MPETPNRTILHVDLDAFYASVEQRDQPALRGRPVVVGGSARRGVVCAASYEARRFGVRSAMPMARAIALCPEAVVLPPRMDHYAAESERFFEVIGRYTPLVEPLSLDEAFLDVTAERSLYGAGDVIGSRIKHDVRAGLDLVASVGVAPSKFVAKVASDVGKPDGLLVVQPELVREFLAPLPVGRLWGVGPKTEALLRSKGLVTIGDVARTPQPQLVRWLGPAMGGHLAELAVGSDARAVEPGREAVSIGREETFDEDLRQRSAIGTRLLGQADDVAARLRAGGLRARTLTLKIKYANHQRISRRTTLPQGTSDGAQIARLALELLAGVPDVESRGVRLCGVSASSLQGRPVRSEPGQLSFEALLAPRPAATAPEPDRGERLGQTMDDIRRRFGDGAIRRAVHLGEDDD